MKRLRKLTLPLAVSAFTALIAAGALLASCKGVTDSVVADSASGTVTGSKDAAVTTDYSAVDSYDADLVVSGSITSPFTEGDESDSSSSDTNSSFVMPKLSKHYLGAGYNCYEGYASYNEGLEPILDYDKIKASGNIKADYIDKASWLYTSGTTVKSVGSSYHTETKLGDKFPVFSGTITSDFKKEAKTDLVTMYGSAIDCYRRYMECISPSLWGWDADGSTAFDKTTVRSYMTDKALTAIDAITSKADAAAFIHKYGTHAMTRVYYGGRFEYNTYSTDSTATDSEQYKTALEASINKLFGGSSTTDSSSTYQQKVSQARVSGYAVGGNAASATTLGTTFGPQTFTTWGNSFTDSNLALASFADDSKKQGALSLLPVWKLAKDDTIADYLLSAVQDLAADVFGSTEKVAATKYYIKNMCLYRTYWSRDATTVLYPTHGHNELMCRVGKSICGGLYTKETFVYVDWTTDPTKAITDIQIYMNEDQIGPGWVNLNYPGNRCLAYTKGGSTPITGIAVFQINILDWVLWEARSPGCTDSSIYKFSYDTSKMDTNLSFGAFLFPISYTTQDVTTKPTEEAGLVE